VEWHLKKVWREITFDDEMLSNNETFDPTASNQNSDDNKEKIRTKMNSDGKRYSGFRKVLSLLSTHVRTTERLQLIDDKFISYESTSKLTSFQKKALKLLENIATYPGKNNAKN
jgi:hypothetical protein